MPHQVRSRLGRAYQMLFVLLAVVLPLQLLAPPAGAQVLPLRDAQGHPYGALLGFDTVTGLSCLPGPAAPTCATFTGNVTANSLPFSVVGSSTPITTGASSGNTAIPATSTLAVLTNNGSNDLYYKLGTSNAVTATSTDNLLAAGRSISVGVGTNTYIAAISPAGASTLAVVGGTGGSPSLGGSGASSGGGGGAVTIASGAVASGAYSAGSFAAGAIVDLGTGASPGANTTNGILKSLLAANSGILGCDGATLMSSANPACTTDAATSATGATVPAKASLKGLRAATALPTALTDGQTVAAMGTKDGKTVTVFNAPEALRVRGAASTTGTGATTLIAAQGAGITMEISSVQCFRTDTATTALYVTLNDSVSTTVPVPPATSGSAIVYNIPLLIAANTALTFTASGSVTTVFCNAQGNQAH